jgi:hypothetical protein
MNQFKKKDNGKKENSETSYGVVTNHAGYMRWSKPFVSLVEALKCFNKLVNSMGEADQRGMYRAIFEYGAIGEIVYVAKDYIIFQKKILKLKEEEKHYYESTDQEKLDDLGRIMLMDRFSTHHLRMTHQLFLDPENVDSKMISTDDLLEKEKKQKLVRKLKKKLRQIELLEQKMDLGENLNQGQKEKIQTKTKISQELEKLLVG